MTESLRCVGPRSVLVGWDFSTGAVKALAFDLSGRVLAEANLPTDLWHGDGEEAGVNELNLMQLEGQARASLRMISGRLEKKGRLRDWVAAGISATHHTAGRIDQDHVQVRRAICWNDFSLTPYHRRGLRRLGGQEAVHQLIGGPWAIRYSLSHLVKDEERLDEEDWRRTHRILSHGPLAAGFLTGNFDVMSVSAAASTGIMDLRRARWCRAMLGALASKSYRNLAWKNLPRIVDHMEPIGPLAIHAAQEAGIDPRRGPLIFPTSDDQQAGLVGGGAVDDGQMAIILGNSAVVNSSSSKLPTRGHLDVMRLNWGPYLWMRCYNETGAQFLNQVVGSRPNWDTLEEQARAVAPGAGGVTIWPFVVPEPSLKVHQGNLKWSPSEPKSSGQRFRASLEALACLIALGVREHEKAGQKIERITVSGGIARSDLMCRILATVLDRRLERLESDEGPALGAAVTALAALESHHRRRRKIKERFTVSDAVSTLVRFSKPVDPEPAWGATYAEQVRQFEQRLKGRGTRK